MSMTRPPLTCHGHRVMSRRCGVLGVFRTNWAGRSSVGDHFVMGIKLRSMPNVAESFIFKLCHQANAISVIH
jgi:hypothetical protein